MQFHETAYGKRFFDGQLPKLISALTDIASALKTPTPVYQLQPEIPEDFLTGLYHGSYDPSDLPYTETAKELTPEIAVIQQQIREAVKPEVWEWVERYRLLLDGRHISEREQAFAAGFQSAMTMLAAGLSCPTVKRQEVSGNGKS